MHKKQNTHSAHTLNMKIFIGNLDSNVTSADLNALFSQYGDVLAANIPQDTDSASRGFGYVLMGNEADARNAINALNKKAFMGQFLTVSEAIHSAACNNSVAMPA